MSNRKYEKISHKYRHIGISYPSVPNGWKPIVVKAIIDIEKVMWPQWLPMFIKRCIHYLATGNSIVRIKYRWAYKLREKLTNHQIITDIKTKYGTLRIYYCGGNEINDIIEITEKECNETCEKCGKKDDVKMIDIGWIYNLCKICRKEFKK